MWNLDNVSFIKFSGRLSFNIILKLEKSGWSYSYEAEPMSVLIFKESFYILRNCLSCRDSLYKVYMKVAYLSGRT